jgi:hypothetical protein
MYKWKIEYLPGSSVGRFKEIEADMLRNCNATGNLIFCDEKDKIGTNNYIPKLVISKGSYLSVQRLDPDAKQSMKKTETKTETKTEAVEWLE